MERADQELLLSVVPIDSRLKKLYDQHQKLERKVAQFDGYARYSTSAHLRQVELKKEKLKAREAIMSILQEYRDTERTQH